MTSHYSDDRTHRGPNAAAQRSRHVPPQPSTFTTGSGRRMSFIEQLIAQGMRGELIAQPWFQSLRQDNPNAVLGVTLGSVGLLSVALPGTSLMTFSVIAVIGRLVTVGLWLVFGYVALALGTPRAHRLLHWASILAAVAWSLCVAVSVSALEFFEHWNHVAREWGTPTQSIGLIVFDLLLNVATAVLFGYLAVAVHRGLKRVGARR
ncbi:hypothetical protein [Mycobacterium sp. 1274756.6]|uniref:hypothetical protein n=1 Tax=Mycobacterium sp. 1274756.6 TaxID=1834076 RepID=UPI000801E7B9|nr:hypothetical protein [Mycobacterium sp. 1274756.6]OBJ70936.1 hypothetical protein A5643_08490 [Mycobacterium sp. 1274756.6]